MDTAEVHSCGTRNTIKSGSHGEILLQVHGAPDDAERDGPSRLHCNSVSHDTCTDTVTAGPGGEKLVPDVERDGMASCSKAGVELGGKSYSTGQVTVGGATARVEHPSSMGSSLSDPGPSSNNSKQRLISFNSRSDPAVFFLKKKSLCDVSRAFSEPTQVSSSSKLQAGSEPLYIVDIP